MERDPALERHLLDVATRAAGQSTDGGFGSFRDTRPSMLPSWGVESDTRHYLAAARDSLLAALAATYPGVVAGDPDASEGYTRRMRALAGLIIAWRGLHGG